VFSEFEQTNNDYDNGICPYCGEYRIKEIVGVFMPELKVIPFNKTDIKAYLDRCIRHWRKRRDEGDFVQAPCYIDAFQSVRTTLFDETLPEE